MALKIYTAPPGAAGEVVLGLTLPSLLDDAVQKYPNPKAFNQPLEGGGWKTMSNQEFKSAADEVGLGLRALGFERGDKVAFFLNSDLYFSIADFGCLSAGITNVPLYTTFSDENLVYVTRHSESRAMFVSNPEMLRSLARWITQTPDVRTVVLAEGRPDGVAFPDGVEVLTLEALREKGRAALADDPGAMDACRAALDAQDVATLIYTSGTTGQPKGVMLTHENISSNALTVISLLPDLGHQDEVVLTFLPLTHVYARMFQFAHVAGGHQIYYSDPERLVGHLPEVRPTVFNTVPRVLEKVYDKVALGVAEASGAKKAIGSWALDLARSIPTGTRPSGLKAIQHGLADKLVYSKLREKLGLTRIKFVGVGGAALRPDLADTFNAFGIPVLQGYGLTETSPVITFNRKEANRAGTVGQPIPGVEVAIAEDGEILTRGPHVMKGYYKEPEQTAEVIDADGWFHTGDVGEFTDEGFLRITDRKKALFKLSTGKYVIPQPIENRLTEHALVEQAVVLGSGEKFCTALVFPNLDGLRIWARQQGIDADQDVETLLKEPKVVKMYEEVVADANKGMDSWSQVKRFRLVPELMTVENDLLTPTMKVKRSLVGKTFADDVSKMYQTEGVRENGGVAAVV
ncbi:MAG: AMP-dependent synthetase/ligase [Rubricoccaceae bacterium]